MDLTYLVERQGVVDTVVKYATGIDLHQWDLYRTVFTDICNYDFSSWNGSPASDISADAWVANVRGVNGNFDATQHISSNQVVTFENDSPSSGRATCVSYMHAQHYFKPETMAEFGHAGETNFCTLGGYYTNQLVRMDDMWKIARCKLTVTWETGDRTIFQYARNRKR